MSVMPVVLWSDVLILLLLLAGSALAWHVSRFPHLLLPWQRLARSSTAMVSLLILSLFVLVGLLDSLHYRPAVPDSPPGKTVYSPEVLSVLDTVLEPLRTQTEKTYSAPFATHAYNKESITHADGSSSRDYPRLKHGGAHLSDVADKSQDITQRALQGAAYGLLLVALFIVLGCYWSTGGLLVLKSNRVVLTVSIAALCLAALIGALAKLATVYHVLGTDKVGQDVLYLALKSIRTGLMIGTITTLVTLPLAVFLGIAAGYFRGWVDDVIQYIYTVLNSIPGVLLIAAAVLMVQVTIDMHPDWFETSAERADLRLVCLCLILGMTSWTGLCRLLRAETMKLREMEYIQAAQAFHVSPMGIINRHILPNLSHIILITLVLDFSGLVLAEAVLSYVGVGVDPSMNSFGNMINDARLEMGREPVVWWSLAAAFGFMLLLVLSANLLADKVRDVFDPRLNRG